MEHLKLFFTISFVLISMLIKAQSSGPSPYFSDSLAPNMIISKKKISFVDTLYIGDTLIVHRDAIIIEKDSIVKNIVLVVGRKEIKSLVVDSIINIADTMIVRQDTLWSANDIILQKVHKFTTKKNLFSRLLSNFFRYEPPKPIEQRKPLVKSDKPFVQYEDKIIRNIDIVVLDPFGYDIKRPDQKPKSLFERAANFAHINSQQWVVKNKLLFKKGEKADPLKLAETERLLRQGPAVYDARLIIKENATGDSLDITVLTQDVFSINVGASGDLNRRIGEISVQDVNFLGLGQSLHYRAYYHPELPAPNHFSTYYINNIHKSFVSANLFYNLENGRRSKGIFINRDFVTPSLKWIGGINVDWFDFPYRTDLPDHLLGDSLKYRRDDIWAGIPTTLFISKEKSKYGKRFIFSTRYINTKYTISPPISNPDAYHFYDSRFYLGSATVFSRRTYKDKFIFRFGRTEDIPEGSLVSLIGGIHDNDRATRPYGGFQYSYSKYLNKIGYYFFNLSLGSYLNKNKIEDGVFHARGLYFTPLVNLAGWDTRHFLGLRFTHGENMVLDQRVYINNEFGLRGFNTYNVNGNEKMVFNYESNYFLPLNIVGFRLAFVVFADFAWISYKDKLFNKSNFYPGYGVGIKIKNEHLTFDAIQILFGFYPNGDAAGTRNYRFFQRSYSFYTFNDFNFSRPDPIPF